MTEEEIKLFCKLAIDNSPRPLTDFDREVLKQVVDKSRSAEELMLAVIAALRLR